MNERVIGPAIMFADGRYFHWQPIPASHFSVAEEIKKHFPLEHPLKQPHGFVTSYGVFVSPNVAYNIAEATGQIVNPISKTRILLPEELWVDVPSKFAAIKQRNGDREACALGTASDCTHDSGPYCGTHLLPDSYVVDDINVLLGEIDKMTAGNGAGRDI